MLDLSLLSKIFRGTHTMVHSVTSEEMGAFGVLMTCPMYPYLEQQLQTRFNLFRLWQFPSRSNLFDSHSNSIQAIVGDTKIGADSELIDALPRLKIVASYSVGLDKIDLQKCKEKGIRVTNTPDVLTEDVADAAIALILTVLRRIGEGDAFVRKGKWKSGNFGLASKVCEFLDFGTSLAPLIHCLNGRAFRLLMITFSSKFNS